MKSAIIVGKGPSVLNTNSDYVNSFDDVVICNKPVWKGYEKYLPKRADIQYTNNSTDRFTEYELRELGLREVVSAAWPKEKLNLPTHYEYLKITYPAFEAGEENGIVFRVWSGKTFSPSTGVLAFSNTVESGEYEKIAIIGFDLLNMGDRLYYFEPNEIQSSMNYLFDKGILIKDGFIYNQENKHDHHALEYIKEIIQENTSIIFEFTTISDTLVSELKHFKNVFFTETVDE